MLSYLWLGKFLSNCLCLDEQPCVMQTTFMGRSFPSLTASRGASQMAGRSYVFGKDDSNSGAPLTDGPDGTALVPSLLACHPCMLLIRLNYMLVQTI